MSTHDSPSINHELGLSFPCKLRYFGILGLIICSILGLFLGSESTLSENLKALWAGPFSQETSTVIMWWIRIPQVLTTLCAGAVLATSVRPCKI